MLVLTYTSNSGVIKCMGKLQRNKPVQLTGLGKSHPCLVTTLPNGTPLGYLAVMGRLSRFEVLWDEN